MDGTLHCFCTSNGQVSEEEPARDERLFGVAWRFVHDVQVWRVEAQSGGRKPISHQVDPQQLDRNQSFRETQDGCEEDAAHKAARGHVSIMSPHWDMRGAMSQCRKESHFLAASRPSS